MRVIEPFKQFFDTNGTLLANGWLKFLVSGSNTTLKDVYSDKDETTALDNPVQLDAYGRAPNIYGSGPYRVISYMYNPLSEDEPGTQVQMFDPVYPPITEYDRTTGFDAWSASKTYASGNIVTVSGVVYRSLQNSNLNQDPTSESTYWEKLHFIREYNANVSYTNEETVEYASSLYMSRQNSNSGNTPNTSCYYWQLLNEKRIADYTTIIDYTVLGSDRGKLIILGSTAVADRTITLVSAGTAAFDGFEVSFLNLSDYDMIIEPDGVTSLWLATSDATIEKGCMLTLRYAYTDDTWWPVNNCAPALGGQVLGTLETPVDTLNLATTLNFSDGAAAGRITYSHSTNTMALFTNASQRLTITSTGLVGIGISAPSGYSTYGQNLVLGNLAGADTGLSIITERTQIGSIVFGDDDNSQRCRFSYDHATDDIIIVGAGAEKLRIDSDGYIGANGLDPALYSSVARDLVVGNTTGAAGITVVSNSSFTGVIYFADDTSSPGDAMGRVQYDHSSDLLKLYAGGVEAIRLSDSVTAGQTRLLVYDVDNGQIEQVTVGAADSGGSGYKLLRIPN